jgi:YHS domain-containing protein
MRYQRIANIFSLFLGVLIVGILLYFMFQKHDPVSVVQGNYDRKPLAFVLTQTNDVVCKMLIRSYDNSAQAVDTEGETYFFNDPGCMVLWLREQPNRAQIRLWIHTLDTHRWIDARRAWYGIKEKTVMGYGFGAREKQKRGSIGFEEMCRRMLRGETLLDPKVRKSLLEDDYVR